MERPCTLPHSSLALPRWWNRTCTGGRRLPLLPWGLDIVSLSAQPDSHSLGAQTSTGRSEFRIQEKVGDERHVPKDMSLGWTHEIGRLEGEASSSWVLVLPPLFCGWPCRLLPLSQHSFLIYEMKIGLSLWGWGWGWSRLQGSTWMGHYP